MDNHWDLHLDFDIVKRKEQADLILTVVGRGIGDHIWGSEVVAQPIFGRGAVAVVAPRVQHDYWAEWTAVT